MTAIPCDTPLSTEKVLAYWFGELDSAAEADLEEHLFACAECNARVGAIADLAHSIRDATRKGEVHAILPPAFAERLSDQLTVREYRVQPGDSVMCTIAPQDDLVVAYLEAPLTDVRQLDVVLDDLAAGHRQKLEDVAFDPARGEIALASNVPRLRQLGISTHRIQLLAIEAGGERVLAEYTFNHSPHRPGGSR